MSESPIPKFEENANKGEGPIEKVYCTCGEVMVVASCKDLYESWMPVFCNECWTKQDTVYHCPTGRNFSHVLGYDICWSCSEKYKKNPNETKHENDSDNEETEVKNEEISDIILNSEGINKISSTSALVWNKVNELNRFCTLQSLTVKDLQKRLDKFNLSLPHNNKIEKEEQVNKEEQPNKREQEDQEHQEDQEDNNDEKNKNIKDNSLTIHELYELKNRLQILGDFQKNIGALLQTLASNTVNNIITHRLQNWQNWNTNEIIEWILSLDTKYRCYEKIMNEKMCAANIKGKHLPNIDKMDLYRFGIEDYQHEIDILGYISNLIYSYPSQEMLKIEEKETEGNPGAQ